MLQAKRPRSWSDWYAFARETLEYESEEARAYANLRHVEDLNRAPHERRTMRCSSSRRRRA